MNKKMRRRSRVIGGTLLAGAISYLFIPIFPDPPEYFIKEGTFRGIRAIASISDEGRKIVLKRRNGFRSDGRDDSLTGIDANLDGHFERIELDNGDLINHLFQTYARGDSLESAYETVVGK